MQMLTKLLVPVFLLSLAPCAGAGEYAAGSGEQNRGQWMLAQSDGASLSEAVERVRRQYNGRIVSAETRIVRNREMHYIKVLTEDGKVKTVTIPGRTRRS